MVIIPLYGPNPDHLSYDRKAGSLQAEISCPDGSEVRRCPQYGSLELFTPAIGHIGEDALVSFADDEDDPDFRFVFTRSA